MKKYKIPIIMICILIVFTSFFVLNNTLASKNNNVVLDKEEIVEYGNEYSDTILNLNVGDSGNLKDKLELSTSDTIKLLSNTNSNILEVDDALLYKALAEGEVQLKLLVNNEEFSANFIINSVINKVTTTSVFKDINNCSTNGKTVYNKNNIKTKECVSNYASGAFQNIAITNDYFYISKNNSVEITEGNKINGNWYVRINRNNGAKLTMKVPYAGHGQSFDVIENRTTHGDTVVFNYISVPKTVDRYSTKDNKGFGIRSFYGTKNGAIVYPHRAVAIKTKKDNLSIKILKRDKFLPTIEANTEDNTITKYAKNSQYAIRPQVATSKENDLIAIHDYNATTKTYFYVYKLEDFLSGKLTKVNAFQSSFYYGQGIEIYGDYIYAYGDKGKKEHYIQKYNIKTGKLEKKIYFATGKDEEGEGISIYNGKIYVACKYAINGKYYLNLYLIEGV